MKKTGLVIGLLLMLVGALAQETNVSSELFRIPRADLAGENLTPNV